MARTAKEENLPGDHRDYADGGYQAITELGIPSLLFPSELIRVIRVIRGSNESNYPQMGLELFRLLRFRGQSSMSCQRVENFRITLGPGVVDRHPFESPLLAVAHQLAIVTVHQKRVFRSGTRALARHEMLRHDIRIQRGRIAADFDLEIADGVTGIQWAE